MGHGCIENRYRTKENKGFRPEINGWRAEKKDSHSFGFLFFERNWTEFNGSEGELTSLNENEGIVLFYLVNLSVLIEIQGIRCVYHVSSPVRDCESGTSGRSGGCRSVCMVACMYLCMCVWRVLVVCSGQYLLVVLFSVDNPCVFLSICLQQSVVPI